MKTILSFALLALTVPQNVPPDRPAIEIVDLQVKHKPVQRRGPSGMVKNTPPVLHPGLGRGADINEPEILKIKRDTAQRMHDMGTLEQNARSSGNFSYLSHRPEVDYELRAEMKNISSKPITSFLWAYQSRSKLVDTQDQELLCDVRIEPRETESVKVRFSTSAPRVIYVSGNRPEPSLKDLVVNQVSFADGTIWSRPGWKRATAAKRADKGKCIAL